MKTTVTYLFDPLCGWCYGASPVLQKLGQHSAFALELTPSGLFAGNARVMDPAFAAYAWSNDMRIAKLTGQSFSEAYRQNVLGRTGSPFDSGATTLALTAVFLSEPQRELEALKVLQEARYVDGLDTCDAPVVAQLLREHGLARAAERLLAGDAEVLATNAGRVRKAQGLMQSLGVQGVPALVVSGANGRRLVRGNALYGSLENLLGELANA